jgi:hypothetical protein
MNRLEGAARQALAQAAVQSQNVHGRPPTTAEKDAAVLKAVAHEATLSATGAGANQQARAARAVVSQAAIQNNQLSTFMRSSTPEQRWVRDVLRANDNGYTGVTVNVAGLAVGQGPFASLHGQALTGKSDLQTVAAGQQLAQNIDTLMTAIVGGPNPLQNQNAAAQVPQAVCDLYATIYHAAANNAPVGQGPAFGLKAVVNFFALQNLSPNLNPVPANQHTAGVTDWATTLNAQGQQNLSYSSQMIQKIFNGVPNIAVDPVQDSAALQQAKQTASQAAQAWVQPAQGFLQAVVARGVPVP